MKDDRAARMDTRLLNDLKKLLGADMVLHRPEELLLYEYDGSVETAKPNCVVFPQTKEHVLGIVITFRSSGAGRGRDFRAERSRGMVESSWDFRA